MAGAHIERLCDLRLTNCVGCGCRCGCACVCMCTHVCQRKAILSVLFRWILFAPTANIWSHSRLDALLMVHTLETAAGCGCPPLSFVRIQARAARPCCHPHMQAATHSNMNQHDLRH